MRAGWQHMSRQPLVSRPLGQQLRTLLQILLLLWLGQLTYPQTRDASVFEAPTRNAAAVSPQTHNASFFRPIRCARWRSVTPSTQWTCVCAPTSTGTDPTRRRRKRPSECHNSVGVVCMSSFLHVSANTSCSVHETAQLLCKVGWAPRAGQNRAATLHQLVCLPCLTCLTR